MDKIISVVGIVWIGFSFLGVIIYNLIKLCYMVVKRCFKYQKKIDISAFTTANGAVLLQDGNCNQKCIFQNYCDRHKQIKNTTQEIHYLNEILKDFEERNNIKH